MDKEILASLIDVEELYQHSPCGYLSFLPDGNIIKINRTLLGWLGYTEAELLDQLSFSDLLSRGGKVHYEMFIRPLMTLKGAVKELSYELKRKDGGVFSALLSATAVLDAAGATIAINAAITDNSERKKYEKELLSAKKLAETEKKRFEFLANLTPEIIWTANTNGDIDYVNERFYTFTRLSPEKLCNTAVMLKTHPEDRRKLISAWLHALQHGTDMQCAVRWERDASKYEWHMVRATPYRAENGQVIKWFGSSANIDEQVMALQRKDEFIHIASHELKTPITSLKAYLQLLERSAKADKEKMLTHKANAALNNLQFLISSLLDVSVINSGLLTLNKTRFSVHELVAECVETMMHTYHSHQIIVEADQNVPLFVDADRQRIMQVLINLISNAVKYSPLASEVIVRLSADQTGKKVTIAVQDKGCGIAEDKKARIFDKFYRVNEPVHQMVSGLGLGLYIIQNLVKLHHSEILVETQKERGSTFYFSLPLSVQ